MEEKNNSRENLEKGKNNKTLIIVLVVLGIILLIGIVFCVINRNSDSNKNNNDNNKDNDVVDKDEDKTNEDIKDNNDVNDNDNSVSKIISNIEKGKKYTKQELIDLGFNDYTIDMNSNFVDEFQRLNEIKNETINRGKYYNNLSFDLIDGNVIVKEHDENDNVISSATIDKIQKIKIQNRSCDNYYDVYFIANDNVLYYERLLWNTSATSFKENLKKMDTKYKYTDVLFWFNYSKTCGASYTYIGKTVDGEYKILDGEYDFKDNTYRILNDNIVITNDRNIYVKDELQKERCKFIGSSFYLKLDSSYVIKDDDYLYNDKFEREKKIVSILKGVEKLGENSSIEIFITIDENGNNDYMYGEWV